MLYWDARGGAKKDMLELSEGLFREILEELPDHSICRQYVGEKVPWGPELSRRPEGAPAWAAALHEAYARNVAILNDWIEHRQAPDGTFGGGLGDDVELFRSWQPLAAISTGTPTVRAGVARLCDGVWANPAIKNGFWGGIMDVEHVAEYTADTQPAMIFIDYGEPSYYERNLEAARHIRDVLTGVNERGMRQFKSTDIGGNGVGDVPEHQADVPYDARPMKAVMWLTWAGNPTARKLFLDWADTWADAAMSQEGGKPVGVIPPAIWYPSGTIVRPSGSWWDPRLGFKYFNWPFSTFMTFDTLNCAYYFTNDPKYLIPLRQTLDLVWSAPAIDPESVAPGSREWVTAMLQEYSLIWQSMPGYRWVSGDHSYDDNLLAASHSDEKRVATKAYTRYLIDHDLTAFTAAMEALAEERRYNFELQTREVLATDRAGVPIDDLFGAYTGAARRWSDMGLPSCAVTWVTEDTDFAALVRTADDHRLKLTVHSFKDRPARLGMRLWQLVRGRYELVSGPEGETPSGLRVVESTSRTFDLRHRGQTEFIEVPPGKSCAVDIRLIEAAPPADALPDLAVGRNAVTFASSGDKPVAVTVRVHNIGAADAGPGRVSLSSDVPGSNPLAEAPVPPIPAPNDLLAKYEDVRFDVPRADLAPGWRVDLRLDSGVEDFNPANDSRSGRLP